MVGNAHPTVATVASLKLGLSFLEISLLDTDMPQPSNVSRQGKRPFAPTQIPTLLDTNYRYASTQQRLSPEQTTLCPYPNPSTLPLIHPPTHPPSHPPIPPHPTSKSMGKFVNRLSSFNSASCSMALR
jgi:hypothetical protein